MICITWRSTQYIILLSHGIGLVPIGQIVYSANHEGKYEIHTTPCFFDVFVDIPRIMKNQELALFVGITGKTLLTILPRQNEITLKPLDTNIPAPS